MRKLEVKVEKFEWWERLMERWKRMVEDEVEVEGVFGRVVEVEGSWDWFGMKGKVTVVLEDCIA